MSLSRQPQNKPLLKISKSRNFLGFHTRFKASFTDYTVTWCFLCAEFSLNFQHQSWMKKLGIFVSGNILSVGKPVFWPEEYFFAFVCISVC